MSENKTSEMNGAKSFEDRVFARFDIIEGHLGAVEIRIGKLEERQYDTRPIWERALAMIAETNAAMVAGFDEFREQFGTMNSRLGAMDGRFETMDGKLGAMDGRLDAMDARFDAMEVSFRSLSEKVDTGYAALATDLENGLRGVERKIDVLNKNILDLQADQRYVDSRLDKIEADAKPS